MTEPKLAVVAAVNAPTACTPVLVKLTWVGESARLVAKFNVPVAAPMTLGENLTFTVQESPAASVAPQLYPVTVYSGEVPEANAGAAVNVVGPVPVLLNTTASVVLDEPTVTLLNAMVLLDNDATGTPIPVPDRETVLVPAPVAMLKVPVSTAVVVGV